MERLIMRIHGLLKIGHALSHLHLIQHKKGDRGRIKRKSKETSKEFTASGEGMQQQLCHHL